MHQLLDYLTTRRSSLSIALEAPGPDEPTVRAMVEIASRVPDHGKLAPWRFEHWSHSHRHELHERMGQLVGNDDTATKRQAELDKLLHAPNLVVVISTAREHPKIPVWEQHLSAGAACMALLAAANAHGFEAQWLTAWWIYDENACRMTGIEPPERVAGLVHVGTNKAAKAERDRPALNDIYRRIGS